MRNEILWIDDVYKLVEDNRLHQAVDIIFERIDDNFSLEKFDQVDSILKNLDQERLHENIITSVLAITLNSKDRLKHRADFFEMAKKRFSTLMPDRASHMLLGLS